MKRPKVLLLGNGINRAFGGESWNGFLQSIAKRTDFSGGSLCCPMSLQAVLLTNDSVDTALKENAAVVRGGNLSAEQLALYQKILGMGFDEIITTNFSYELESAWNGGKPVSDYLLKSISQSAVGKPVEAKYLLHSYNSLTYGDCQNRVWHIHGEARKPNSMILGQYYYATLLCKIREHVEKLQNRFEQDEKRGVETPINSWIDALILGDVYVVGFGFDFSELDLWYLLARKKREKAKHGSIFFFEPLKPDDATMREKHALLEIFGAHVMADKPVASDSYVQYYEKTLNDISRLAFKTS